MGEHVDPLAAPRVETRLDDSVVAASARRLADRIMARFPTHNLPKVARELCRMIALLRHESRPSRTQRTVRTASAILIAVIAVCVPVTIIAMITTSVRAGEAINAEWISIMESLINDLVFSGIAIAFLWVLPQRMARSQALRLLHRLRSLAHVVDMHQLTKDPDRYRSDFQPTQQTITPDLTPAELSQYLDYCSELLALIGKSAALLADHNTDSAVLAGVADIESLTGDLSRKIWQKIALLPTLGVVEPDPQAPDDASGRLH